jgi:hypothetical protein
MLPIDFAKIAIELVEWLHFMDAGQEFEIKQEIDEPPFGDGKSMVAVLYRNGDPIIRDSALVLELLPMYIAASESCEDENPDVEGYLESMRETND